MNSLTKFSLLLVSAASLTLIPSASSARRGADDPAGHCRQCDDAGQVRGREVEAGDVRQARGADDVAEVRHSRGADDVPGMAEVHGGANGRGGDGANSRRHNDADDRNDDRVPN